MRNNDPWVRNNGPHPTTNLCPYRSVIPMDITEYLERTDQPRDLYELLFAQRFDPDVEALRKTISQASRELLPYQGHADPQKAKEAMRLMTDLGAADTILSNEEKLRDHNCQVAENLLDDYLDHEQIEIDDVNHRKLAQWLVASANVHEDAVKTVVQDWLKESLPEPAAPKKAGPKPKPKRPPRRRPRKRRRLDELFDDVGAERGGRGRRPARRARGGPARPTRGGPARPARGGPARGGRGPQRGRRKSARPPWLPFAIGGGALFGLILLIVIYKLIFPTDYSATITFTVDPPDSSVETDVEGTTVNSDGDQRHVTIADARGMEESVQVSVLKEGYVTGGFRWTPEPGKSSTLEQVVKLPRETSSSQ